MGLFSKKDTTQPISEEQRVEQAYLAGMTTLRDLIAPSSLEMLIIFVSALNLVELYMFTAIHARFTLAGLVL